VVDNLRPGDLSRNTNWMFIQSVGNYISPIGNDKKHTVTVYQTGARTENTIIAEIECTNSIYSEWLMACAVSMWHTENKVAQDIHGNFYPLGDMCGARCTIRYDKEPA
jgi:hypothetical protein